jgi:hypothetical protein
MRAAVYWAPGLDDPLWRAGCAWLGRDAETGARVPQPAVPGIAALTAEPAQYGLHATLRPPMRLATGWDEFRDAVRQAALETAPFALPPLELANIHGFLALREAAPCPLMRDLADRCVIITNPHRLPPGAEELARRRRGGLSARQEDFLQRWGYPYVMEEWFFHVTLTRRLSEAEWRLVLPVAEAHFAGVIGVPRLVDTIAVFTQSEGNFLIAERFELGIITSSPLS